MSDIDLPGMDGVPFLGELRRRHPETVRILCSDQGRRLERLRTTGVARRYLAKPLDSVTLERSINRASALREHLKNPHLAATVNSTNTLPSAPTLYNELVRELQSDDPSLARVGAIVRRDPAMTATILRVVNSAYFGLRRRVRDIGQAVSLLGSNTITALVLSSHLVNQVKLSGAQTDVVEALWKRSVTAADLAKAIMFCDASTRNMAEEAYLAAILGECGKLVFAVNWPAAFIKIERTDGGIAAERQVFGTDHALVGAYLLALWGLPDDIVEAVAFRYAPSMVESGESSVLAAVHAAYVLGERDGKEAEPALDMAFLESAGLTSMIRRWTDVADHLAYEREYA